MLIQHKLLKGINKYEKRGRKPKVKNLDEQIETTHKKRVRKAKIQEEPQIINLEDKVFIKSSLVLF